MCLPNRLRRLALSYWCSTIVFYIGASEGEPRQQIFPQAQIEDYRNAITWLSAQKEVDANRIGLWGISYSGGHVLHLGAYDKRVKAVASLLPLIDALQGYWVRAVRQDLLPELRAKLAADRAERYVTGKINYMPVVAPEGQPGGIPGKAAYDFFMAVPKVAPNWKNQVTLESVEQGMELPARRRHSSHIADATADGRGNA
jgi:uncharacterized protein